MITNITLRTIIFEDEDILTFQIHNNEWVISIKK